MKNGSVERFYSDSTIVRRGCRRIDRLPALTRQSRISSLMKVGSDSFSLRKERMESIADPYLSSVPSQRTKPTHHDAPCRPSAAERRNRIDTEWVMLVFMSPSDRCGSGKNPLPQCAFKVSMFNVSAIHINSRSWLRSSSTHEPSDPPLRIVDLVVHNL